MLCRFADKVLRRVLRPRPLAAYRAMQAWRVGEPEIRLVKFLCDPELASIDVGAADGGYTYFLRNYSRVCYSFEPNLGYDDHPTLDDTPEVTPSDDDLRSGTDASLRIGLRAHVRMYKMIPGVTVIAELCYQGGLHKCVCETSIPESLK